MVHNDIKELYDQSKGDYWTFADLLKSASCKVVKLVSVITEKYVDDYIREHNKPPTYRQIQVHFGLASTNSAYARCKNFRCKLN